MAIPDIRPASFSFGAKYRLLGALLIVLFLVIVLGIVLSAASFAVLAILAGAIVALSSWLIFKIKSLTGASRRRVATRRHKDIEYHSYGDE